MADRGVEEDLWRFRQEVSKELPLPVNPWSKSFVRHLHHVSDPHYAQKHPDEDWAETFATWLDPGSHWKEKYRNWPHALEKLAYVDSLMEEIAGQQPANKIKKHDGEYTQIEETVSEWWGLDGEVLDQELQEYLKDMNEIFLKILHGPEEAASGVEADPEICPGSDR